MITYKDYKGNTKLEKNFELWELSTFSLEEVQTDIYSKFFVIYFRNFSVIKRFRTILNSSQMTANDYAQRLQRKCKARKMVFCYQNCYDQLWGKNILVIKKNFWNSRLKAKNFQICWDHLNNLFKQWKVRTRFGNRMLF